MDVLTGRAWTEEEMRSIGSAPFLRSTSANTISCVTALRSAARYYSSIHAEIFDGAPVNSTMDMLSYNNDRATRLQQICSSQARDSRAFLRQLMRCSEIPERQVSGVLRPFSRIQQVVTNAPWRGAFYQTVPQHHPLIMALIVNYLVRFAVNCVENNVGEHGGRIQLPETTHIHHELNILLNMQPVAVVCHIGGGYSSTDFYSEPQLYEAVRMHMRVRQPELVQTVGLNLPYMRSFRQIEITETYIERQLFDNSLALRMQFQVEGEPQPAFVQFSLQSDMLENMVGGAEATYRHMIDFATRHIRDYMLVDAGDDRQLREIYDKVNQAIRDRFVTQTQADIATFSYISGRSDTVVVGVDRGSGDTTVASSSGVAEIDLQNIVARVGVNPESREKQIEFLLTWQALSVMSMGEIDEERVSVSVRYLNDIPSDDLPETLIDVIYKRVSSSLDNKIVMDSNRQVTVAKVRSSLRSLLSKTDWVAYLEKHAGRKPGGGTIEIDPLRRRVNIRGNTAGRVAVAKKRRKISPKKG